MLEARKVVTFNCSGQLRDKIKSQQGSQNSTTYRIEIPLTMQGQ
jgi:hypothetical protein